MQFGIYQNNVTDLVNMRYLGDIKIKMIVNAAPKSTEFNIYVFKKCNQLCSVQLDR